MKKIIFLMSIVFLASVVWYGRNIVVQQKNAQENSTPERAREKVAEQSEIAKSETTEKETLNIPLRNTTSRITKKPFGIFITPQNSPVQPERFSGFHTGTDFEIFPEEIDADVPVFAVCGGEIIERTQINGYGGAVIHTCALHGEDVTVLYGHIDLARSSVSVGDAVKQGEQIAILGDNQSKETDGERKHLHLGMHRGTQKEVRGYVQTKEELDQWLDFEKIFADE